MKKIISLMLSFLVIASITMSASALVATEIMQDKAEVPYEDVNLQQTIDEYFHLRGMLLLPDIQATSASVASEMSGLLDSPDITSKMLERMSATNNLAQYHNVYVINSANNATIMGVRKTESSMYEVNVYEWTWIEYSSGKEGHSDVMGYATEHQMFLQQDDDATYKIINDIYDDSDILGVPSNYEENEESFAPINENELAVASANGVNSDVNLNVNALIDYADKWVVHEYATTYQNPSNYNKSVYGYYAADCANFTSQCLRAGGMQFDYGNGKNNGNWDGTQWWFDVNPNPNYENYNVSPPSWRYVPKFIDYWEGQGYSRVSATASTVFPGNPVINDTGHVGICVGYNSSGTPIINAHNRDVYHVPYTMIGNGTKTTIQIVTNNKMQYKPSDATEINPSTTSQSILKYMNAGSNHYYTFTVSSAGYYTFESSYYSSSRLDTKATLYKASTTSNNTTLYLDEIAANDDGGDDLNFKIREYLSPGIYYIRVRAYGLSDAGYYNFIYKKG